MFSAVLSDRLDTLIDDLILDGGVESASLASILLAAKDSVESKYLVTLSRQVWAANNELRAEYALGRAWGGVSGVDGPPACDHAAGSLT